MICFQIFDGHSFALKIWSGGRDLNPQPSPWKSETLPLSYPRPVLLQIFPRRGSRRPPLNSWSLGPGLNR